MEKEKLRKADIFSGSIISLFGLWILLQSLKMPMKGSWGGVQNVWYVSPAIFPLFIGSMIMLLGLMLIRTAYRETGPEKIQQMFRWLGSSELLIYLKSESVIRFYAVCILFLAFIFLNIPRIDFLLCSILFLVAFISMFYLDNSILLKKMLCFYLGGSAVFILWFISGLPEKLSAVSEYPSDWPALMFILSYIAYAWKVIPADSESGELFRKKYRTALIIAIVTPFFICTVFKYFLLVPMPTEGLVVSLMDTIRYMDF